MFTHMSKKGRMDDWGEIERCKRSGQAIDKKIRAVLWFLHVVQVLQSLLLICCVCCSTLYTTCPFTICPSAQASDKQCKHSKQTQSHPLSIPGLLPHA